MVNFKEYTRFAASNCPNLPPMVFARAMLTASRQYFHQTQAWQETYEVPLEVGVDTYETPLPYDCALIDAIVTAKLNGTEIKALTHNQSLVKDGTPKVFHVPNKDTIVLWPTPNTEGTLELTYALKPSINTEELPEHIFDEHFEALISGTIFELKRMVNTDWHDPSGAGDFLSEFRIFIDQKRIEMLRGYNNADLSIDYSKGNY